MFEKILHLSFILVIAFLTSGCATAYNKGSFSGFQRSLNITSYGYQVIDDPTGQAPTKKVERFEVRPGDCAADAVWSDCKNDRERSELAEMGSTPNGVEAWYGWSFYMPADFPNISPTKTAIGQFHQRNGPPAWMFQVASDGGYYIDRNFGHTSDFKEILKATQMLGRWSKIEVHALWHAKDGFFKVYANGELKYEFHGKTADGTGIYFKYGVYRTGISWYVNSYQGRKPGAQSLLFSNVKRGKSRGELEPTIENSVN